MQLIIYSIFKTNYFSPTRHFLNFKFLHVSVYTFPKVFTESAPRPIQSISHNFRVTMYGIHYCVKHF